MNIEPLKKKIQEANPEIMELKFGCEVEVQTRSPGNIYVTAGVDYDDGKFTEYHYCFNKRDSFEKHTNFHKDNLVSLGRPIRLADVLAAINRFRQPQNYYAVTASGIFIENMEKKVTATPLASRLMSTGTSWNLLDDNLDHQSDECKQFLIDLLT